MSRRTSSRWLVLGTAALGMLTPTPSAQQQGPGARESSPSASVRVIEGYVLDERGGPAEGAVVTSSAGGRATVGRDGNYRFETCVPDDAESLRVTATARRSAV